MIPSLGMWGPASGAMTTAITNKETRCAAVLETTNRHLHQLEEYRPPGVGITDFIGQACKQTAWLMGVELLDVEVGYYGDSYTIDMEIWYGSVWERSARIQMAFAIAEPAGLWYTNEGDET